VGLKCADERIFNLNPARVERFSIRIVVGAVKPELGPFLRIQ
jgi:hypothetical protein